MDGAFLPAREAAASLIGQFGTTCRLTRRVGVAFDPVSQTDTATALSWNFLAVGLPPSQAHRFKVDLTNRRATEFFIAHGDQLMGEDPVIPAPGDVLTLNGRDFTLFWSQTYDPDATLPVLTVAYGEV